jgi:hypothetical protein
MRREVRKSRSMAVLDDHLPYNPFYTETSTTPCRQALSNRVLDSSLASSIIKVPIKQPMVVEHA